MLTDTTFWIDLAQERERRRAGPAHGFLAQHRAFELQVSVITWGELAAGVESPAELDRLLRRIRTLGVPLHVAWEAGRIERELDSIGGALGENDLWIAATARAWGNAPRHPRRRLRPRPASERRPLLILAAVEKFPPSPCPQKTTFHLGTLTAK